MSLISRVKTFLISAALLDTIDTTSLYNTRLSVILMLASIVLASADSLPLAQPDEIVAAKVETCRVKEPRADGDWRTGRCRKTKRACAATGGEAYR